MSSKHKKINPNISMQMLKTHIDNDKTFLQYIPEDLRTPEIVEYALNKDPLNVRFLKEENRSKKDFLVAVNKVNTGDIILFRFLPSHLKEDDDVVIPYLKKSGMGLKYLPAKYTDDKDCVLMAIKSCGQAYDYASKRLQQDKEVILAGLKAQGKLFETLSKELQEDREICLAAFHNCGSLIKKFPKYWKDREMMEVAIKNDGNVIFVTNKWKYDEDLVAKAVRQNVFVVPNLPKEITETKEFLFSVEDALEKGKSQKSIAPYYEKLKAFQRARDLMKEFEQVNETKRANTLKKI